MTQREIFDKVKTHLLTQNAKSQFKTGKCAYRDRQGRKCAVGCLIDDKVYSYNLETLGIHSDSVTKALLESGIIYRKYDNIASMLLALQRIHDYTPVKEWEYKLNEFERIFKNDTETNL